MIGWPAVRYVVAAFGIWLLVGLFAIQSDNDAVRTTWLMAPAYVVPLCFAIIGILGAAAWVARKLHL